MPSRPVDAHIEAQARLRALVERAVAAIWLALGSYNKPDVPRFVSRAVPVVVAGQRQSIALTDAYLALVAGRPPLGINPDTVLPRVRGGVPLEQVYERPFVDVWSKLAAGVPYADAVAAGLARAKSTAVTDVQMTMRAALAVAQDSDASIRGYQRVADPDACEFCLAVNGAFVKSADAMALHNGCGCGLEPVFHIVKTAAVPDTVAVHEHGELGPTLTAAGDHFTTRAQALS